MTLQATCERMRAEPWKILTCDLFLRDMKIQNFRINGENAQELVIQK